MDHVTARCHGQATIRTTLSAKARTLYIGGLGAVFERCHSGNIVQIVVEPHLSLLVKGTAGQPPIERNSFRKDRDFWAQQAADQPSV